ncbi:hypothetical protein, partial [Pseudomonas monteilii]|uniref:hypothetical protein n=1 Tax=Pseudomonas monteilii TaxID=76759 RepID=UPI001E5D67B4
WAGHAGVSFWLAYMHLLLMLCPNTKFLTPSQRAANPKAIPSFSTIRLPPLGVYLRDSYNQPISPLPRHRTHD